MLSDILNYLIGLPLAIKITLGAIIIVPVWLVVGSLVMGMCVRKKLFNPPSNDVDFITGVLFWPAPFLILIVECSVDLSKSIARSVYAPKPKEPELLPHKDSK